MTTSSEHQMTDGADLLPTELRATVAALSEQLKAAGHPHILLIKVGDAGVQAIGNADPLDYAMHLLRASISTALSLGVPAGVVQAVGLAVLLGHVGDEGEGEAPGLEA